MTDDSSYNLKKSIQKRRWITGLLFASTLLSALLLWKSEPVVQKRLQSASQLDSLLSSALEETGLSSSQLQKHTVRVDSLFSRSVYRVYVAPGYSKTSLHYSLQQAVWPYGVSTVGLVEFPARTLNLHFMLNDNILSSVIIIDDPELRVRQSQTSTSSGQASHEVD
ncbi:hypothetical protein [Rhodohalobacter mucosus]|uniref:Uncharacterized protein n=1 Tax=Rhodohalobacter mucosus TaxID=2079485 RepID=A0A316TNT4_9BACT|nr:hypothetical protein [Rhodohalobacter mucosus]PWN06273.1 hypothetical protein DDZ15_10630 [Rhodohalobacter mucosus]